ncbi:MAG: hypothetical protein Q7V88_18460 [Actinomycetota bacterium]|nr:hypothetical protein [Actinomycetota bacterium]
MSPHGGTTRRRLAPTHFISAALVSTALVSTVALALAGCGDDGAAGPAATTTSSPPPTTSVAAPVTTSVATAAPARTESEVAICMIQGKTLATATEAFLADTGALPTDEQALVDAGMLRTPVEDYDLVVSAAGFELVATPRCQGVDWTGTIPGSGPASGEADCAIDLKVLQVALEAYEATNGAPAATEAELVPEYLRQEVAGYDWNGSEIVPVAGVCD